MTTLAFLRDNARWIAGGFLLCFFSSFGQTFFIALSGGEIRAEYGLSNGEWGSLYMLATLASAVTLTQFGRIIGRYACSQAPGGFVRADDWRHRAQTVGRFRY